MTETKPALPAENGGTEFTRFCKSRSNNPSLKRPIGLAAPE